MKSVCMDIANDVPKGIKRKKYDQEVDIFIKQMRSSMSIRDLLYEANKAYMYACTGEKQVNESLFTQYFEEAVLLVELATGTDTENVKEWKQFFRSKDYLVNYIKARKRLHQLEKQSRM